jgi:hypothetical protein
MTDRTPTPEARAKALNLGRKPWEVVLVALALDDWRTDMADRVPGFYWCRVKEQGATKQSGWLICYLSPTNAWWHQGAHINLDAWEIGPRALPPDAMKPEASDLERAKDAAGALLNKLDAQHILEVPASKWNRAVELVHAAFIAFTTVRAEALAQGRSEGWDTMQETAALWFEGHRGIGGNSVAAQIRALNKPSTIARIAPASSTPTPRGE